MKNQERYQRKSVHVWTFMLSLVLTIVLLLGAYAPLASSKVLPAPTATPEVAGGEERVSRPGEYRGYSQPVYDEWVRISQYITVRDGTRLAADIFRPAVNGQPVSEPLPVLWTHRRYQRATVREDGKLSTILNNYPWMETVLKHGYVIAAVDQRGSGASYGTRRGAFTLEETLDGYDVTEWFAAQPWCDGNVGMYGVSYGGITQYMTAGTAPPHLKAIMPIFVMFDLYSFVYPGGVFADDFIVVWSDLVKALDTVVPVAAVDEDTDRAMLAEAIEEHKANTYPIDYCVPRPYRDSRYEEHDVMPYFEWSPHSALSGIQESGSGIAIYHLAGWYDMWPRDQLTWFNNLDNPQKIIIPPYSHSGGSPGWRETVGPLIGFDLEFDIAAEHLRWFDYWLKGIDNGITDEPPILYFTTGAPEGQAWRTATEWPLPDEKPTRYYFHAGPSGSVASVNDGLLSMEAPTGATGQDDYTVDYTTTSGTTTRWTNGRGGDFSYPDMTANDEKALTYTTPPLTEDIEVTGHPVVHLWVTSTADDGDFFVYLEEVDGEGYSHYITEGVLRASRRALAEPPYKYMGLPYHRSFEEDIEPLPEGEPVELVFDLHPTSSVFDKGHRIRVTVTGADQDNFLTPELLPVPTVSICRNADHASYIVLPIIPASSE